MMPNVGNNHQKHQTQNHEVDSSDDEQQLYFSIKLPKYSHPLQLTITYDHYKSQFRQFIQKYQLTRDQSLALKDIIKTRLAQLLQKQKNKNNYEPKAIERMSKEKNPDQLILKHQQNKQQHSKHKGNKFQPSKGNKFQPLKHQTNKQHPYTKRLFASYINSQLKDSSSNRFHNLTSPISSIHSNSIPAQETSIDQQQDQDQSIDDKICENDRGSQQQTKNYHNYIQDHHQNHEQQHVSFNDFYQHNKLSYQTEKHQIENVNHDRNEDLNHDTEDIQTTPKALLMGKLHQCTGQIPHQFFLNHQLAHVPVKSPQYANTIKIPINKKTNLFTPVKHKPSLASQSSPTKIPKIHKGKQIPQNTKIQPTQYNKRSSPIQKTTPQKKSSKSTENKPQNSPDSITKRQKQIIHEIFYRLHREETASSIQRQKPQKKQNSRKQQQDQRVVLDSVISHRKKYMRLSEEQKQQLFTKLYLSSTQSSMNRKSHLKNSINYSNQIQNVINQTTKMKQYQKSHSNKKYIFKPSNSSQSLYASRSKRCNAHCEQHQYQKRVKIQQEMKKKKEQQIKQNARQRSKQSIMSQKSFKKSTQKKKISGQCQCCHKQKIDLEQKKKNNLRLKSYKPSFSPKTKYSLQKRFLPTNISFISDVLEQSYIQLFPTDSAK